MKTTPTRMLAMALFLATFTSLQAQPWFQNIYINDNTDEEPHALEVRNPNSFAHEPYIIGRTGINGINNSMDLMVLETDANGNLVFSQAYGSNQREIGRSAIIHNDTLVIAGLTNDGAGLGANEAFIYRLDMTTNTIIGQNLYSSNLAETFNSIEFNGTNYVVGTPAMSALTPSFREFGQMEITPGAGTIFQNILIGDPTPTSTTIQPTDLAINGTDYFQVAYEQVFDDGWFLRTDNAFNLLNLVRYNYGPNCDMDLFGVLPVGPNLLLMGRIENCNAGLGQRDILALVVDPAGNILNQRIYGGAGNDEPRAMRISPATATVMISGYTDSYSAGGDDDIFLLSVRPDLSVQSFRTYIPTNTDERMAGFNESMQVVADSIVGEAILITGYEIDDTGDWDVFLYKTPSVPNADEICVDYPRIDTILPGVTVIPEDDIMDNWGTRIAVNRPNVPLNLSPKELCFTFKWKDTGHDPEQAMDNQYAMYPNPTHSILEITFNQPMDITGTIRVFDLSGRMVHQATYPAGVPQTQVNLVALPAGTYVVEVTGGQDTRYRERITKY